MTVDIKSLTQLPEPKWRALTDLRRTLHANPELAFAEHETARRVTEWLTALALAPATGVGVTGVVALIKGDLPGPTVGLRADMDALPIRETSGLAYASRSEGVMHACGHDLHTVLGLGAASLLAAMRPRMRGAVKLIFQPAEETMEGALAMVADGVLKNPTLDALIGFHNSPQLPAGTLQYMSGVSMASVDAFDIEITGLGAHAAQPHNGVDAVMAAADLVGQLQRVVARELSPLVPAVLTIGRLEAGTARNVLAQHAVMKGTLRALDAVTARAARSAVERIVAALKASHRVQTTIRWSNHCPPLRNDPQILDLACSGIAAELGPGRLLPLAEPSMGSEDFAFFAEQVPSAHLRIGTHRGGQVVGLHRADYDANDEILESASHALAAAVLAVQNGLANEGRRVG